MGSKRDVFELPTWGPVVDPSEAWEGTGSLQKHVKTAKMELEIAENTQLLKC